MSRANVSQDSVLSPFLNDTRSRQASIDRHRPLKPIAEHGNTTFLDSPNYINMMQLPRIGTSAAGLPLRLFDNKNPLFYTEEHLKKCFLLALKKLQYAKTINEIDRDTLRDIFIQFGIFTTRLQLEEAYQYSIVNLKEDDSDDEKETKPQKKNSRVNLSMDCRDKSRRVSFLLAKFLKWLKKNMHKMRNLRIDELKALQNFNKPAPILKAGNAEGEKPKDLPAPDQRKLILSKIARDKHYWDLRTRMDQEEVFRKKNVVPHILEMGFDHQAHLLNPETLIPRVRLQYRLEEYEKTDCVRDISRLKDLNRDIKDRLEPVVMDANQEKMGLFKAGNIMETIVDSFKKKLKEDESNCKKYAAMAKARLRQRKLEKELRTNLEMSAILQEQDTAVEAARLYELMCNDRATKELKSFKKTLSSSQERRIQHLMKENF